VLLPLDDAQAHVLGRVAPLAPTPTRVTAALGCVLAEVRIVFFVRVTVAFDEHASLEPIPTEPNSPPTAAPESRCLGYLS
jgi:hypothetical protein